MIKSFVKSIEIGLLLLCALVFFSTLIFIVSVLVGVEQFEADKVAIRAVMGIGAVYVGLAPFKSLFLSGRKKNVDGLKPTHEGDSMPQLLSESKQSWKPILIVNGLVGSLTLVALFSSIAAGEWKLGLVMLVFFLSFLVYSTIAFNRLRHKASGRRLSGLEIRALIGECFGGQLFVVWFFATLSLMVAIIAI
jgi:hypothetical protein